MKKFVIGGLLFSLLIAGIVWVMNYYGLFYHYPEYLKKTVDENIELTNYEREFSLSLSFEGNERMESVKELSDSILVLHEKRDKGSQLIQYSLNIQDEEFRGERMFENGSLVVKSPMYHRYVDFYGTDIGEIEEFKLKEIKPILYSFISKNKSSIKTYRDIGGNEEGVITIILNNKNEDVKQTLLKLTEQLDRDFPFYSLIYENVLIKNKILKEDLSEKEIEENLDKNLQGYKQRTNQMLINSQVESSNIYIKFSKEKVLKEISVDLKMNYLNPDTKTNVRYSLYFSFNTWNVGKTKVESLALDPTKSISYDRMTDDIKYFEDENKKKEENEQEDLRHINRGYREDTSTLKDLIDNSDVILAE